MMGWFVEKLEFFLELEGSDDLISITSYFALFKINHMIFLNTSLLMLVEEFSDILGYLLGTLITI